MHSIIIIFVYQRDECQLVMKLNFICYFKVTFQLPGQNETNITETIRLRSYIINMNVLQFSKDLVIELTGCCWHNCLLRVLWNPMEMLLGCMFNSMLTFLYHFLLLLFIIYLSFIWLKICIHAIHVYVINISGCIFKRIEKIASN